MKRACSANTNTDEYLTCEFHLAIKKPNYIQMKKLEWIFDYYIAYFLYNPNKIDRYYKYLRNKWDFKTEEFLILEHDQIDWSLQSNRPSDNRKS